MVECVRPDEERRPLRDPSVREAWDVVWRHLVVEDGPPAGACDAIFCFGSRHWRVAQRGATLHGAGIAPVVLATGGVRAGDGGATEAERLGAALVARGIPPAAIVLERHARHTLDNVRLGMAALRAKGPVARVVLVAWPLASRRCVATFARQEPGVEALSAPALRRVGGTWRPTRRRIGFALGELDRLERYAAAGHLVAPPRPAGLVEATRVLERAVEAPDAQRTIRRSTAS